MWKSKERFLRSQITIYDAGGIFWRFLQLDSLGYLQFQLKLAILNVPYSYNAG
jgi:hypothetical protein